MELTKSEIELLKSYGYTSKDVYDVRGMTKERWTALIRKENKQVAYGSPCTNGGHRLKWRSGHCAHCKPISKVYSDRFYETKYIYIAGSLAKKLMKIGVGDDPKVRVAKLRFESYASANDWQLLFQMKVPNAGRLEHDALSALAQHRVPLGYMKDGIAQEAIEALNCGYVLALTAVVEAYKKTHPDAWQSPKVAQYEFR